MVTTPDIWRRAEAQAIESTINCFETSPNHGRGPSGESLGLALRGKRQDMLITPMSEIMLAELHRIYALQLGIKTP